MSCWHQFKTAMHGTVFTMCISKRWRKPEWKCDPHEEKISNDKLMNDWNYGENCVLFSKQRQLCKYQKWMTKERKKNWPRKRNLRVIVSFDSHICLWRYKIPSQKNRLINNTFILAYQPNHTTKSAVHFKPTKIHVMPNTMCKYPNSK